MITGSTPFSMPLNDLASKAGNVKARPKMATCKNVFTKLIMANAVELFDRAKVALLRRGEIGEKPQELG